MTHRYDSAEFAFKSWVCTRLAVIAVTRSCHLIFWPPHQTVTPVKQVASFNVTLLQHCVSAHLSNCLCTCVVVVQVGRGGVC